MVLADGMPEPVDAVDEVDAVDLAGSQGNRRGRREAFTASTLGSCHGRLVRPCRRRKATVPLRHEGRGVRIAACTLLAAGAALIGGCGSLEHLRTPQRMQRGWVVILPGIEGPSILNRNLAVGLDEGGVDCAIEVYNWSSGLLGGPLRNLMDLDRNLAEARTVALWIERYDRAYPDRPVVLIGHSGGGGVALLVLEALSIDRPIAAAMLLAAAASPEYDLRSAVARTQYGIWNFYSPYDVGLNTGTKLFGTVDRRLSGSAGAVGFRLPAFLPEAARPSYFRKVHQVRWQEEMRRSGNLGGHLGWTWPAFARSDLAPLIRDLLAHGGGAWPPATVPDRVRIPPPLD